MENRPYDLIWNTFKKSVSVYVDLSPSYIHYDQTKQYYLIENEQSNISEQYKNCFNVCVSNYMITNIDSYCNRMLIDRIDLLHIGSNLDILKNCNILKYTDFVIFKYDKTTSFPILSEFKYIYMVEDNFYNVNNKDGLYIAMKSPYEVSMQEIPKIFVSYFNHETDTVNRNIVSKQLAQLGFPYEIINYIDHRKLDIQDGKVSFENIKYTVEQSNYNSRVFSKFLTHRFAYLRLFPTSYQYHLIIDNNIEIKDLDTLKQTLSEIPQKDCDGILFSEIPQVNNTFEMILYTKNGLQKFLKNDNHNYDEIINTGYFNFIKISEQNKINNDKLIESKSYRESNLYADLNGYSRMGNCMFQYAFLKSLSLENNMNVVLNLPCREMLLPYPNLQYKIGSYQDAKNLSESCFQVDEELLKTIIPENSYNINGYFQSYKYFDKYRDVIKNCFEFNKDLLQKSKHYFAKILNEKKLCGVHLRLPDFREKSGFIYSTPSEKYIKNALNIIKEKEKDNVRFVVFSNDIDYCFSLYKHLFPSDTVFYIIGKYEDFVILSLCDHNIIGPGTYGWWASYLNKNLDKTIVALNPNFNPEVDRVKNNNEKDYYPPEWILLDN